MKATNSTNIVGFLLIGCFLDTYIARAEEPKPPSELCVPRRELLIRANSCKDNSVYVKAAEICLAKIDAKSKLISTTVADLIQKRSQAVLDAQGSGQNGQFESIERGLDKAVTSLGALKEYAMQLRAEMEEYSHIFVWPYSLPPEIKRSGKAKQYLMGASCYKENQNALQARIASADKKIAEIDATSASASNKQAILHDSGSKLQVSAGTANKAVKTVYGKGSAAPVRKPSSNRQSDITGIKEDEQKQKTAPTKP